MSYLTLSIRCLLPTHPQKNCLIKIHNRELNLCIELDNLFIHNYEYIYRLWPSGLGDIHGVQIEIWEKLKDQQMKMRGMAKASIISTHEGQRYRFHGDRNKAEIFLMCFKIEENETEGEYLKEYEELRKINSQMEHNLLKYREQIQGYRDFLYFTNNVIKDLNSDQPQPKSTSREQPHSMKADQIKQTQVQLPLTKRKNDEPEVIENSCVQVATPINTSRTPRGNTFQSSKIKEQKNFLKNGSRASKAINYLSKYRYLDDEESIITMTDSSKKMIPETHIKTIMEESTLVEGINKQKHTQITTKIKHRRDRYLIPRQIQQQPERERQASVETPINRLSSHMSSQISKLSKPSLTNHQYVSTDATKINNSSENPMNYLKTTEKESIRTESIIKKIEAPIQTNDESIKEQQKSKVEYEQLQKNEQKQSEISPSSIVKTVVAPVQLAIKLSAMRENESIQNKSVAKNISRRKRFTSKNDATIMGELEQMKSFQQVSKHDNLKGNTVSKLTILRLRSTFYANFKSSTKKCIIEHNNQVFETNFQQNNLKNTTWEDRILISGFSPMQDLVFMVYALKMNELELEGTAVAKTCQIIASSEKHFKFYLYFDNIVVGNISFDVQRQLNVQKRLTVSLPEIKLKQSQMPVITSKTIRTMSHSKEYSKLKPNTSQRKQPSCNFYLKRSSMNSDIEYSRLLPRNQYITKKHTKIEASQLLNFSRPK